MAGPRERADHFLVRHGFALSRAEAQAAIAAGHVAADGAAIRKPAQLIAQHAAIAYTPAHPYVSRGGVKLAAALDRFALSPQGAVCLDIGASTGGFTQVLLERGAARVYAVDVGHGQMRERLASDPRVVRLDGLNARALSREHVPQPPSGLTADVSFISLKLALAPALQMAAAGAWAVLLVKPQFELGPGAVSKSGVVRDESQRQAAVFSVSTWVAEKNWIVQGSMESPIAGGQGNREYLLAARKSSK